MAKRVVQLKGRERAVLLMATRFAECHECHATILPNQKFWLDFIPLRNSKILRHVVCLACWKGPYNIYRGPRP